MNLKVFSHARLQSSRCPRKMVRPFGETATDYGDTTLTDIMMSKLMSLKEQGFDVFFAGRDGFFERSAVRHDVPFVARSEESDRDNTSTRIIFSYLEEVDAEWLLFVNPCLPFLTIKTILDFVDQAGERPAFGVIERTNYFIDIMFQPVNWDVRLKHLDTQRVTHLYEFAHALYLFRLDYFLEHGFFWSWNDVKYVPLTPGTELWDVNTEDDFQVAETLWRRRSK